MKRDETPDATNDPAPARRCADSTPTGSNEALLRAIRERHPEPLAVLLYEAELESRAALVEKYKRLQARLAVLKATRDLRLHEGEHLLAPLHAAMEAARAVWEAACVAHEAQRIKNQSATVPLDNQIAEVIAELNRPIFEDRVTNWQVPDWYKPSPEIPRLGVGPRK